MKRVKRAARTVANLLQKTPPKMRKRILIAAVSAAVAYGLVEADRADLLLSLALAVLGG